ncbi:MAG: type III-A CRISPR-associated RAMP protein Csm3 [Chloroflexi bacterium]|nr:type III-A CRISPR-associated RAMP protein Csm3 [Chloroflexota bacterium]
MSELNPLYGKVIIRGEMTCETGLHIGAASGTQQIGGIDSPVVRDPVSGEPYIPGSSLKGKLRSLLERAEMKKRHDGSKGDGYLVKVAGKAPKEIRIHVCQDKKCPVCRLFGSTPMKSEGENMPSPVIVSDLRLKNGAELLNKMNSPLRYTEWKAENTLDRITAHSNPRDIERIPRGARFELDIVYNVADPELATEDIHNLVNMLYLLQDDYLGGSGSRGYGRVKFHIANITARKLEFYTEQGPSAKGQAKELFQAKPPADETKDTLEELRKQLPGCLSEMGGFMGGKN